MMKAMSAPCQKKTAKQCTMLAVEPGVITRIYIEEALHAIGVIDFACSGREALENTRHNSYDIVLINLRLPDIRGELVARLMRARQNHAILIATSAEFTDIPFPFDAFISKPLTRGKLLEAIKELL